MEEERAFVKNVLNTSTRDDTGADCSICMENYHENTNYVRCRTCKQPQHSGCLRIWFASAIGRVQLGRCPRCRADGAFLNVPEFISGSTNARRLAPPADAVNMYDGRRFMRGVLKFLVMMIAICATSGMWSPQRFRDRRTGLWNERQPSEGELRVALLIQLALCLWIWYSPIGGYDGGGNRNRQAGGMYTNSDIDGAAELLLKVLPYFTTPLKTDMTIKELVQISPQEAYGFLIQMGIPEKILEPYDRRNRNRNNNTKNRTRNNTKGGKRIRTRKNRS